MKGASVPGRSVLAATAQPGINIPERAVQGVTLLTQQAVRACRAMNSTRQEEPEVANISLRLEKDPASLSCLAR